LHIKDLRNALETASAFDSPTPLTNEALMILQDLHDRGEGQNDHSAIAHYYERLAGIKIRKKDDVL
jgi:2-hydroxy-3-oxopropionate reductase